MSNRQTQADVALQAGDKPEGLRVSAVEIVAGLLSLAWLAGAALFFVVLPSDGGGTGFDTVAFVMTLLAVFLPVAVIWVAAIAMRSARIVREESRRLQAAVDAMRQTYVADRQARGASGVDPTVERKLNEIAQAAQKTETTLATFTSARPAQSAAPLAPGPRPAGDDQPTLALGTSAEDMTPPVARSDLILALNFPDTEDDEVGFAALRRALKDHGARQLIQASQDVLTLLSQDGIYMDDLHPDRARPEFWRRFARGERGKPVAALGGVRDRSSLALTAGRMREDTIFRDAAHHFLRKFDQMLEGFEKEATDEEVVALSETRTARAFMLLGRVTGAFD
jgi:type II secretory pathway pseudopilin PulG